MTTMQINGAAVEMNSQGFLSDYHNWNRDIARAIAEEEGLELTDCHWEVINFMRDYYGQYETPPSPKLIVAACGEKMDPRRFRKELRKTGTSKRDVPTDKVCPECGRPMRKRKGKYGLFWGCTGYPQCRHTEAV